VIVKGGAHLHHRRHSPARGGVVLPGTEAVQRVLHLVDHVEPDVVEVALLGVALLEVHLSWGVGVCHFRPI
jgi:hypothetical protein